MRKLFIDFSGCELLHVNALQPLNFRHEKCSKRFNKWEYIDIHLQRVLELAWEEKFEQNENIYDETAGQSKSDKKPKHK